MSAIYDLFGAIDFPDVKLRRNGEETSEIIIKLRSKIDAMKSDVTHHTLISTCKLMKVSVSKYFSKVFAKIVRGCTDYSSMLHAPHEHGFVLINTKCLTITKSGDRG